MGGGAWGRYVPLKHNSCHFKMFVGFGDNESNNNKFYSFSLILVAYWSSSARAGGHLYLQVVVVKSPVKMHQRKKNIKSLDLEFKSILWAGNVFFSYILSVAVGINNEKVTSNRAIAAECRCWCRFAGTELGETDSNSNLCPPPWIDAANEFTWFRSLQIFIRSEQSIERYLSLSRMRDSSILVVTSD